MLLEEYLSSAHWRLQTSNQPEEATVSTASDWRIVSANEKASSLSQLNNNILLICLLLEGVGNFAKVTLVALKHKALASTNRFLYFSCKLLVQLANSSVKSLCSRNQNHIFRGKHTQELGMTCLTVLLSANRTAFVSLVAGVLVILIW